MPCKLNIYHIVGASLLLFIAVFSGIWIYCTPKTIGDSYTVYPAYDFNQIAYNDDGSVSKRLTIAECKRTVNNRWTKTFATVKPLPMESKTIIRTMSPTESPLAMYYVCSDNTTIIGELEDGSEAHIKYHGNPMKIIDELYEKHKDEIDTGKYDIIMGQGYKDLASNEAGHFFGNFIDSVKNVVNTIKNGESEADERKYVVLRVLKGQIIDIDNKEKKMRRGMLKIIHMTVPLQNTKSQKTIAKAKLLKRKHHGHKHTNSRIVRQYEGKDQLELTEK